MSTQWAAQFLVAAELERHGYVVSFTMGHSTPVADLMVGHPVSGAQFWVDVGLAKPSAWWGRAKPLRQNLFYVLTLVSSNRNADRFFILSQAEWDGLIQKYREAHPNQKPVGGFNGSDPLEFENQWSKLPNWQKPTN